MSTLAKGLGYQIAPSLLDYWLSGQGGAVELDSDTVTALAQLPEIRAKARLLAEVRLAYPGISDDSAWVKGTVGETGGRISTDSGADRLHKDLHLALKDFDLRVVNVSQSTAGLSYRVQILKHYDFHADQDFTLAPLHYNITVPGPALVRLPGVGLAQDFDIVGTSDVITQ